MTAILSPAAPADAVAPRSRRRSRRAVVTGVVGGTLLAGLVLLGLMTGSTPLGVGEVLTALGGGDGAQILWRVRLPRVVAAVVIGAALGLSGAVFQSISRNPLGSPDLIGFVTGAATGAVVALTLFDARPGAVSVAAVVGGLVTAVAVLLLSRRADGSAGYRLVLVGIGAGAFLQAVNSLVLTRVDGQEAIAAQLWLVGSLTAIGWSDTLVAVVGLAAMVPVIAVLSRHLVVMELGDDFAGQVGVRVQGVRIVAMMAATGLAAAATAAAGPISFVALAAPHLVRRIARTPATPFALSALSGAVLLLAADLAAQSLPLGLRVPVALMTGVLGGVYLLWLLTRSRWR
ncbi:FecCD family ABC transporter permease [Isoptericola aurantiacus]|uniref:FecCD family ABC transporter permease n=1 Tax=Isoptericola aurantiacus TaxID=3377839 RepID=UPI00383B0E13